MAEMESSWHVQLVLQFLPAIFTLIVWKPCWYDGVGKHSAETPLCYGVPCLRECAPLGDQTTLEPDKGKKAPKELRP